VYCIVSLPLRSVFIGKNDFKKIDHLVDKPYLVACTKFTNLLLLAGIDTHFRGLLKVTGRLFENTLRPRAKIILMKSILIIFKR